MYHCMVPEQNPKNIFDPLPWFAVVCTMVLTRLIADSPSLPRIAQHTSAAATAALVLDAIKVVHFENGQLDRL
jgi:hypothetical protein